MKVIDATGMHYKELNATIKQLINGDAVELLVRNVQGQRYIGSGIRGNSKIIIDGIPGNDMASYMDGATMVVHGNAQDGVANTMNDGKVVIHGNAGDILGYAMRGGEVYIKGDVGYRAGIHMKEYSDKKPVIVIGGRAGAFLGEYMAGGIIILLGLNVYGVQNAVGSCCGTGMHGGIIYSRLPIEEHKLGKEVKQVQAGAQDMEAIGQYVKNFCKYFEFEYGSIMDGNFVKIYPCNHRPYGNLYAY